MSSNRAWMPLHIETYLADTGYLTAAEHGAYMLLIMTYWRDGGLPTDERMIARIAKMSKEQWEESRDVLASFFKDGWRHSRIDAEMAKADDIIEKRRAAANGRHGKSKPDASAEQTPSKSTDTDVPPRTSEPSSSSFHSEDAPPKPPEGEGAALFERLVETYPKSSNTKLDRAEKQFRRLSPADQALAVEQARPFEILMRTEASNRGRPSWDQAKFTPGLDAWLRDGRFRPAAPSTPATTLPVLHQDDPLIPVIEKLRGKPIIFGTKGTTTVTPAELEKARSAA
jgi:uncharacterized protein YdaU (DUF1376 family)